MRGSRNFRQGGGGGGPGQADISFFVFVILSQMVNLNLSSVERLFLV